MSHTDVCKLGATTCSSRSGGGKTATATMTVPPQCVGLVIGKEGKTLHWMCSLAGDDCSMIHVESGIFHVTAKSGCAIQRVAFHVKQYIEARIDPKALRKARKARNKSLRPEKATRSFHGLSGGGFAVLAA
jgi:hypothetical protein